MLLTKCKNLNDSFIKNEYILDFEKSLMTRNYIYDNKTYEKHRVTDLSIKKENVLEKFIYRDNNLILTDKVGYPQFYTQLVFEKNNPIINIKTVINNEEKKLWKLENTSSQWKSDNLITIQKRLSGWQLQSFKDSYKHKTENGISLFKRNLLK